MVADPEWHFIDNFQFFCYQHFAICSLAFDMGLTCFLTLK